jgi:hypothetical protein
MPVIYVDLPDLIEKVATAQSEREFQKAYRKAVKLLKTKEKNGERMRQSEEDLLRAADVQKEERNRNLAWRYVWAG